MTTDERQAHAARVESRIANHGSRLSIIVAMSKNGVIGAKGAIPWRLPDELRLFKRITMGHHIIMGRKTWDSIGRLLPGRTTVIVSRQPDFHVPGAVVVHSIEEAVAACGADEEIFVIGGAELIRSALPLAHRLYLTTVDAEVAGDTYMPHFEPAHWRKRSSERHPADERHPHAYVHTVHERVAH